MDIPKQIKFEIELLVKNGVKCKDWVEIKKYLLKCVAPEIRKLFSTRDPKMKTQSFNEFEESLLKFCELQMGCKLRREHEK